MKGLEQLIVIRNLFKLKILQLPPLAQRHLKALRHVKLLAITCSYLICLVLQTIKLIFSLLLCANCHQHHALPTFSPLSLPIAVKTRNEYVKSHLALKSYQIACISRCWLALSRNSLMWSKINVLKTHELHTQNW